MKSIWIPFLLLILVLLSCDSVSEKKLKVKSENTGFNELWAKNFLDSVNKSITELVKNGDSVGIGNMYWPDAELLISNEEPITGSNIVSAFGIMIRMGIKHFTFSTTDVKGSDEFIIETGKYEMKDVNNSLVDRGKYLVIWQNRNGEWRLYRDIGNSSMPSSK